MKISVPKKIFIVSSLLSIWQLLILPIKSYALEYQALVPDAFSTFSTGSATDNLGKFLAQAFSFGLAIAAALAVIMVVWGGVEVMLSESMFKKEDGHKKIQDAIWGLVLALVSWLILYTINPEILKFKL